MTVARIGTDFIVNSTTDGNQSTPSLTALNDGRFVATWGSADTTDGSGSCIRARIFNADGTAAGTDFTINSTTAGDQFDPRLATLSDGRFVAIWGSQDPGDGAGTCIRARVYNADGTPVGSDFIVNGTATSDQFVPTLTALEDGRFVASWFSGDNGDGSVGCIRARIFSADGTAIGDDFIVNSTTAGQQLIPTLLALADGRFVAIWDSEDNGDGSGSCVRARIYNVDGTASGDDFIVNSTTTNDQSVPRLMALADGRFVASWVSFDTGDGSLSCIRARIFNADGTAAGDDFIVNSTVTNDQFLPVLTELADGRFVASWWSLDTGDGSGSCIRARIFNADGTAAGDDFIVNSTTTDEQRAPTLIAMPDGRFVVSWDSLDTGDGSGRCVRAQIFDPTIFVGTAEQDIWRGGSLNDVISGLNGNDTLSGEAGNDAISGDQGDDLLNGGLGADNLSGGVGADTLDGGGNLAGTYDYARYDDANHGNLVINLANATLNTGAAAGDTYIDIEGLVGGVGNDRITGDGIANALWGMAGNDFVFGGGGADYINGGNGADNLYGGAGADRHIGGSNLAGTYDYARYDDANHGNLVINLANATLNTGAAAGDTYSGIEGLVGGVGNDQITGDGNANALWGGSGNDMIEGGAGADYLNGGAGTDTLSYAGSNAAVNVNLNGGTASGGHAQGDTYTKFENLTGSGSNDTLSGNTGNNAVRGGDGNDTINAWHGNDSIHGGLGNDTLRGSLGVDRFYFDTALNAATNMDIIADFSVVDDFLMLDDAVFAAIGAAGFLTAARFATVAVGGNATTVDHRIVYEQSSGRLFHDADGSGAGVKVQFAQLTAGTALTAGDIWVY